VTTTTVDRTLFEQAVAAAIRAPSLHNTQPWRFRLQPDGVEVLIDRNRGLPVADPSGWGQRIAVGAATFNLRLAFAAAHQAMALTWRPQRSDAQVAAVLTPEASRPASPAQLALFEAVPRWRSHRKPFWNLPVEPSARVALLDAARSELAWLELLTGHLAVAAVAEICRAADRVLERREGYRTELQSWMRGSDGADDGVPTAAAGPRAEPQDLFPQRAFGDRPRGPGRDYEAEPLVGILGTAGDTPYDQLVAGYALQRVLLTATSHGLSASLLSQAIEVPAAREQLRMALSQVGAPQMVLRIGHGTPGMTTPRRPVADVIDVADPASGLCSDTTDL
jgi:nitroreductase